MIPVAQIVRLEIVRIRGSLASFDPRFANHVLGLLRQLLEFAQERGIVTDIPTIEPARTRAGVGIRGHCAWPRAS